MILMWADLMDMILMLADIMGHVLMWADLMGHDTNVGRFNGTWY